MKHNINIQYAGYPLHGSCGGSTDLKAVDDSQVEKQRIKPKGHQGCFHAEKDSCFLFPFK